MGRPGSAKHGLVHGLHGGPSGGWKAVPAAEFLDDFNREGSGIELDFLLAAERVIRSLNQIIE